MRVFILSIMLVALSPLSGAELLWGAVRYSFYPSTEDKVVTAEYYFKNTGSEPVTIASVKAGCSCCTAAATDKTVYAPGENGKVVVTFKIGSQFGLVEKKIVVTTGGSKPQIQELTLAVHLRERFTFTPERLTWEPGSKEEKVVEIEAIAGSGLRVLGVRSTDARLAAQLKAVDAALGRYTVTVTPWEELEPLEAQLLIKSNFPVSNPSVYQVPMTVAPQAAIQK